MSNELPVPTPNKQTKSTARTLIQAAALAAALVPLGSVALEADNIACGFGDYYGGSETSESCHQQSSTTNTFDWGAYSIELSFEGLVGSLYVDVTDFSMTQTDFDNRESIAGETYDCVTLVTGADGCRDFEFSITKENEFTTWSGYSTLFQWNIDTNITYPNGVDPIGPVPGQVRVLQNPSGDSSSDYTIDMCITYGVTHPCEYFPTPVPLDPRIRSGDTDFSSMTVAWTPTATTVPEPSSLLLLGTGVSAMMFRRRRRGQKPEEKSTA